MIHARTLSLIVRHTVCLHDPMFLYLVIMPRVVGKTAAKTEILAIHVAHEILETLGIRENCAIPERQKTLEIIDSENLNAQIGPERIQNGVHQTRVEIQIASR